MYYSQGQLEKPVIAPPRSQPARSPKVPVDRIARLLKGYKAVTYRSPQAAPPPSPARALRRHLLRIKAHAQINGRFGGPGGSEPQRFRRRMAIKLARNWFKQEQKAALHGDQK